MFKRLLVAALFALTMIAPAAVTTAAPAPAAPPPVLMGGPPYMYYYDYWSDSTYTVLVGEAWRRCDLEYIMIWGQETPYMTYDLEFCWA